MSDGNFNRSLLPAGGYAAGVRAGEARMKARAMTAFKQWYERTYPCTDTQYQCEALNEFREALGT